MKNISKQVIVPYNVLQMFALVDDFSRYKEFLPWCTQSRVLEQKENYKIGRIDLAYLLVKLHFTTKNTSIDNHKIEMVLVDGPFKDMHGYWQFVPLGTSGSKLIFNLDYEFENKMAEKIIGKFFEMVLANIVDSFIKEAKKLYGK